VRKEIVIWTKKKINAATNTIKEKKGGIVIEKETIRIARDSEPEKERRRRRKETQEIGR
jgi:hypothetical protein